jgi:hypothetical protein
MRCPAGQRILQQHLSQNCEHKTMPKIAEGLQEDPDNEGWVVGWAVYRLEPWDLYGVCTSKKLAQVMLEESGTDYIMDFGSHQSDTEDFVATQTAQAE